MSLRFTPIALAAVIVALAVVAAPARAQSVEACYTPSGSLYLINQPGAPTACSSAAHKQITLTSVGPAGPQGPTGPTGPAGPAGPTGASGPLAGLEFHSASTSMAPSGSANYCIFFATCSAGKSVLNFGYDPAPGNPGTIFSSRPAINGQQVTWALSAPANTSWTVYWTCVDGLLP